MRNARRACLVITTAFREAQPSYHDTVLFLYSTPLYLHLVFPFIVYPLHLILSRRVSEVFASRSSLLF